MRPLNLFNVSQMQSGNDDVHGKACEYINYYVEQGVGSKLDQDRANSLIFGCGL